MSPHIDNYSLNSSQTPWAHLFVLIICEITTHIRSTQHSNLIFTPNTLCRAHNLMSLHTYKVQNHNASTSKTCHFDTYPNPNRSFIQHFLLIICEITTHIPLKYRILRDNTQCKVYHSMPLHTYTANFATSSILQEMLLTGMHTASIPQTYD